MKARKVKKLDPTAPLGKNAARIVRTRVDELRSFAPEALAPDAIEAQHDMRIAAKRLRYLLELMEPCFGDTAREGAKAYYVSVVDGKVVEKVLEPEMIQA